MPLFDNSLLTSKSSASPQPIAISLNAASPENSFKASYFRRSQQAIPRGHTKARCFADTARVASNDGLSKPEAALANQIQQYRQANGLHDSARCLKALSLQSRDEKRTSGFNRLQNFQNPVGFCCRI